MIKEKIKEELKKKNWTIKKLSIVADIRYPSLTEFLKGNKELYSKNIENAFVALNISLNESQ